MSKKHVFPDKSDQSLRAVFFRLGVYIIQSGKKTSPSTFSSGNASIFVGFKNTIRISGAGSVTREGVNNFSFNGNLNEQSFKKIANKIIKRSEND